MKNKKNQGGLIYSTNPSLNIKEDEDELISIPKEKQTLKIILDKKQRAGKKVSLILGYQGSIVELSLLAKEIKHHCGVGGSVKDDEIIIQGDFKTKICDFLIQKGYTKTKII